MKELQICKSIFFREHPKIFVFSLKAIHNFVPQNRKILLCLSRAYEVSRNWDNAQLTLDETLALMPDDLDIRWMFGMLLFNRGQYGKALVYLEYCVEN